jgi:lipopolysaccharide/colanic/teichoic acid biosynthesis glycosyltransferase
MAMPEDIGKQSASQSTQDWLCPAILCPSFSPNYAVKILTLNLRSFDLAAKRGFDVIFGLIGMAVGGPIFAACALAIAIDSGSPVIYRGVRVGKGGKRFFMLKFRTMVTDADRKGGSSTPNDDPRITRVGAFLRRHKLDELPQLWNVVRGDMSFVGPRPQVEWVVNGYTPIEQQLLDVRPGITDYASLRFPDEGKILHGSSDPDRDYMLKIHPEKVRLGLEYVRKRTLLEDLRIIGRTLLTLAQRGST